jgi:hypothetical protein
MKRLHAFLEKHSAWYAAWHQHPGKSARHGLILGAATLFAALAIAGGIQQTSNPYQAQAVGVSNGTVTRGTVQSLTSQFLKAVRAYAAANSSTKPALFATVTQLNTERQTAILEELGTSDNDAGAARASLDFLPQSLAKNLPPEIASMIEQPVSVTGKLSILHWDNFRTQMDGFTYGVTDQSTGKQYTLHFAKGQPSQLTGTLIQASGTAINNELVVAAAGGGTLQTIQGTAGSNDIGSQQTIVILINFTDNTSQPYTSAQENGMVFTDSDSVNAYYQADSFGQTSFAGTVTTQWFTLPYTEATVCTNYATIGAAADQAATNAGYNLSNYVHKMYIMPNAGCGWGGISTIGGNPSQSWVQVYGEPYDQELMEHELGHSLGFYHASTITCGAKAIDVAANCTEQEYGDNFDPMGYYNSDQSNPAHKAQATWIANGNVQTVSTNGTYTLAPLETTASTVQILKIYKPDTGEYYYIGYRQPIGTDVGIPSGMTSGATIYIRGSANTYLVDTTPGDGTFSNAALSDGTTFSDTVNGIVITQVSHSASGVTLSVSFSGLACSTANPTVSISPVSQSAAAGKALTYAVSVKNNDSAPCSGSTFAVAATAPSGWAASPATSLTLAPGATGQSNITITSPIGAANASYALSAAATDVANASHAATAAATAIVYTPPVDTIPPTVSITSPINGAKISGTSATISVSATDNVGVTKVQIYIDGSLAATDTTAPYSYKWTTRKVSSGSHTITAKAYDAAGNVGSASITVTK